VIAARRLVNNYFKKFVVPRASVPETDQIKHRLAAMRIGARRGQPMGFMGSVSVMTDRRVIAGRIGGFLGAYLEQNLLEADPFQTIDRSGVGQLIEMAVQKGRATRKDLKIGICGEQGGDPASVKFCSQAGLNYVSCSPYRVPIARLAAAQAALGK
jgi:hypothetical protein